MTLQRKTPMKRTGFKSKPKSGGSKKRGGGNEFPESTRQVVRARSGGRCEVRSLACTGTAAHFHHRKLKRHKDQRPINCLHACTPCHRHIHDNTGKSYLMGWLVHSWAEPADIPSRYGNGGR